MGAIINNVILKQDINPEAMALKPIRQKVSMHNKKHAERYSLKVVNSQRI